MTFDPNTTTTFAPGPTAIHLAYLAATERQVREGSVWYDTAHAFATGLAERFDLPGGVRQAAAIIAALSPQQSWGANQRSAVLLLETGSTFGIGANIAKARRIIAGESPEIVFTPPDPARRTGEKVRSFFRLIANPSDPETVCVDRHATDIALGRPTDASALPAGFLTFKRYSNIADAYRLAAEWTTHTPAQVQAITWVARRHNKYREGAFD